MRVICILLLLLVMKPNGYAIPVFTLHHCGEDVILYVDSNMQEPSVTIHPYKSECNAGIIVDLIQTLPGCLLVKIGDNFAYCRKGTVAVNTRNYNGEELLLYESPDNNSAIVGKTFVQQTVQVFGIESRWLYVEALNDKGEKMCGWLPPCMQCPSPWTTCP